MRTIHPLFHHEASSWCGTGHGRTGVEDFHPPVDAAIAAGTPPLYAYTGAALERGVPSMAQGRPSGAPHPEVERKVQEFMAHNPQFRAGYPNWMLYQSVRPIAGLGLLKGLMGIQTPDEELMKHIFIGGFARTTLEPALNLIFPKQQIHPDNADLSVFSKKRLIVAPLGCWPIIFDLADNREIKIPFRSTGERTLEWGSFENRIRKEIPQGEGDVAIYVCNPNNPFGDYHDKNTVKSFLRGLHAFKHQNPEIKITVIADNPYYAWLNPSTLADIGHFPSFLEAVEELRVEEGLDLRENLFEINSGSKAFQLAAHGGSVSYIGNPKLLARAIGRQTTFQGLPTNDQMLHLAYAVQHAIDNPDHHIEYGQRINHNLRRAHQILEDAGDRLGAKVVSSKEHGAYIVLKPSPSMLNKQVLLQGKRYNILDAKGFANYLLYSENGVGVSTLHPREFGDEPHIRLFIDVPEGDFLRGMAAVVENLCALNGRDYVPGYARSMPPPANDQRPEIVL